MGKRQVEKMTFRVDANTKYICGNLMHRRFAYLCKKDHSRFGILLATDSKDAHHYLGSRFHIKQTWLTSDEEHEIGFDRERRWAIVSSIFRDKLQ